MANKKLGTAASELKLPAIKSKGDKKPKWQAKTGKGRAKAEEVAVGETTEQGVGTAPAEQPIEAPTIAESSTVEPTAEQAADDSVPLLPLNPPLRNPRSSRSKLTSSPRR